MKTSCILRLIVGYLIVVYVLGGIVYAFNPEMIYGTRFQLVLLVVAGISEWLLYQVIRFLYKRDNQIVHTGTKALKEEFSEFIRLYSINRIDGTLITIIILLGGTLRILGFDWGKVASWQADERKLTDAPINMINYHVPYTDDVYYPNQFISKIVTVIVYLCKRITGTSIDHMSSVWVIFLYRIIIALCGTITIFTAFLIGNYLRKHLGCIFATLVALYPYYINLSKQVTGDVTVLTFLSVVVLSSVRYIDDGRDRYLWMMSVAAAMATMEKWHGAVGIGYIGIVFIVCSNCFSDYVIKGFKAVGIYILAMLIIAPNAVANPLKTINEGFVNIAVYDGSEGSGYINLMTEYIKYGYEYIFGLFGLLILIVGLLRIIAKHDKRFVFLLLGPIKILCLCFLNRSFSRWGLELYFSELFIIAYGIVFALFEARKTIDKKIYYIEASVTAVCAIIMVLSMISSSLLAVYVAVSSDNDSRLVQRHDCLSAGIRPENMTSQYYSGFAAASRCDSEYPGLEIDSNLDWSDYIVSDGGKLYRTLSQPDYICLCPNHFGTDKKLQAVLDDKGIKKIFEYKTVCSDVFFIPFKLGEKTLNEFRIIKNNTFVIRQIQQGGLTGEDIVVYDVTGLPVIGQR